MYKTIVVGLAALIVVSLFSFLFVSGIFDTIELKQETKGPYYLIYRSHKGEYEAIRFILSDVYKYVQSGKMVSSPKGFAVFYDKVGAIPRDSLRSIAGVISDSLVNVNAPYKLAQYEKTDAVVGTFPLRSFFSYMTGTYKFYPQLESYLKKNNLVQNGPVLEIYNQKEKIVTYIASIDTSVTSVPEFD